MTSSEVRQAFLDFFKEKGHHIIPSAPIVVKDDPSLMFINAGMNQFKDYFLGNRKSAHPRVVDTQKCLRVSGKHNDLEEVGVDTYHHTMFEMLGNWSFGDPAHPAGGYFKKEAIAWAWELLTKVFQLEKDRLYVTVFEGDEKEGLSFDEDAYKEWAKWISPDRILKGNKKDNFWEMGDTGPCGPCSEIHIDCRTREERAAVDGKTLVNADHPEVIEIWNIVFIQFNRKKDKSLDALPARHVDTGMGFERLIRVLQGKNSNYDTDIFTGTIAEIERITGKKYTGEKDQKDIAFRVLSDHIRAISFTIADGQLPSNTGAGYVVRRILRRAVRYYYSGLNYKQPLLFQLVPVVATQFDQIFPELKQQESFIIKIVREEEESFLRTLEKGLKRMEELMQTSSTGESAKKMIAGKDAFELYDTYGFPLDLTKLLALENGYTVDETGFEAAMQQQKNRSRVATAVDAEDWIRLSETAPSQFVGYDDLNVGTQITQYRKVKSGEKEQYQLVLKTTPFYAESGGQVGDKGKLVFDNEEIVVADTRKENDLILHITDRLPADVSKPLRAIVDADKRIRTMYNHTATHLLHAALKQVLGSHVNQKGSLVSPGTLRFDVSHFSKITEEEIRKVEHIVNEKIRENLPVTVEEMPKKEALKRGAMALFGEKYGEVVRVVTIDPTFSTELCGGTHVMHTGMIGFFMITSESAVAAGVRRIEAVTGPAALKYVYDRLNQNKTLAELLKTQDIIRTVEKLMAEKAGLEKKVEKLEARELLTIRNQLLQKKEQINQVAFIGEVVEVNNAEALKKLCADLKNHLENSVLVLCANIGGKASVAIGITNDVAAERGLDAAAMIKKQIAPLIKGGGGGQKTMATAGGQDAGRLQEVIAVVKEWLNE